MTPFSVIHYMYICDWKQYHRFSFWYCVYACVRERDINRRAFGYTFYMFFGLRDNWVWKFQTNWKLKQLHRQLGKNWLNVSDATRDYSFQQKQLFAFFHVFIATILWKTIQRVRTHTVLTPNRFDCEMSSWRDLLFSFCEYLCVWMEATNLTINFQAEEWNVQRVLLLYSCKLMVVCTQTLAYKLNNVFQYAVSFWCTCALYLHFSAIVSISQFKIKIWRCWNHGIHTRIHKLKVK